jgi:thiol-disulfide isomerase/thioredoxin
MFKIHLEMYYPGEVTLIYKEITSFYANPGDSIHILLDGKKFKLIKISGDRSRMNLDYITYFQMFHDSIREWKVEQQSIKNMNPFEYQEYIEERTEYYKEFSNDFLKKYKPCKQFKGYLSNYLQYQAMNDLMGYRWYNPYMNGIGINNDSFNLAFPKNYFNFLNETSFDDEKLINTNEYISFLHEYSNYFNDKLMPKDSIDKIKNCFKNKYRFAAENIIFNHIKSNSNGFLKDILLARFFYKFLDWNDLDYFEKFYDPNLISNKKFTEIIDKRHNTLESSIKNSENYTDKILNDLKLTDYNIIHSIIQKYPNKILYIDFWAPWCGPCLEQINHANELHKKYENQDIVFVYLANRCTEKSWKITITERKIKGKHIRLEDDQYDHLAGKLKIKGIPHYVLIDKDGTIISSNAPRPSMKEEITRMIDTLLEN